MAQTPLHHRLYDVGSQQRISVYYCTGNKIHGKVVEGWDVCTGSDYGGNNYRGKIERHETGYYDT